MDSPIVRADWTSAARPRRSVTAENAIVAASNAVNIRARKYERADIMVAASAMRQSAVASL
ncbi:hypothetical protein D3C71_2222820 [compost metagenome]